MLDAWIAMIPYIVATYLVYLTTLVVYRCFFHPLSHIPGPFLARATHLYEWYYDLWLKGQYTWHLEKVHQKYGPVIRINPDEVHIHDADYFDCIYTNSIGRVNKSDKLVGAFGPFHAVVGTKYHELHHIRKTAMSRFFSAKAINELVPTMIKPLQILCDRLSLISSAKTAIDMKFFFLAVTIDIMNGYCFAHDPQHVLKPDFGAKEKKDIDLFIEVSMWNYQISWILTVIYALPDKINRAIAPAMATVLDTRAAIAQQIEAIRNGEDEAYKSKSHRTIIHDLLESQLPEKERETNRLRDEAFVLVTAGSDTTANVLRGTAYHISANKTIQENLYSELRKAIPDPTFESFPSLSDLERLPYLNAVILEGLRTCTPITHRLGREFPDKTLVYNGISIPAGTSISMTAVLTHNDENIFPEPYLFRPERWLDGGKALEKYMLAFSGGSRGCVGITLARAELFLILAAVFRRFRFDVSQVDRARDVDFTRDFILGAPSQESAGMIVKVEQLE